MAKRLFLLKNFNVSTGLTVFKTFFKTYLRQMSGLNKMSWTTNNIKFQVTKATTQAS